MNAKMRGERAADMIHQLIAKSPDPVAAMRQATEEVERRWFQLGYKDDLYTLQALERCRA